MEVQTHTRISELTVVDEIQLLDHEQQAAFDSVAGAWRGRCDCSFWLCLEIHNKARQGDREQGGFTSTCMFFAVDVRFVARGSSTD